MHPVKVTMKEFPLVACGSFPHDARFQVGDLLEMEQVFERMPVRRHAQFEFLHGAAQPVGEIKARDIPICLSSEKTISGGKVPDKF